MYIGTLHKLWVGFPVRRRLRNVEQQQTDGEETHTKSLEGAKLPDWGVDCFVSQTGRERSGLSLRLSDT